MVRTPRFKGGAYGKVQGWCVRQGSKVVRTLRFERLAHTRFEGQPAPGPHDVLLRGVVVVVVAVVVDVEPVTATMTNKANRIPQT